jgi:hypothetical protein
MEVILCFEVPHFKTPNGCNHNQMSQQWQRTQGLQSFFFGSFSFSYTKDFFVEIFYNMLLKVHIISQYITFFVLTFDEY